ncbi:MAG: PQQ-like beta-propeller repeat protein [Rickettsiales bacterium]|jgi:outer membrane protein assembly factor BamB|nr:PQQ-like beta-propeller repeat protein [Rickettsiales bacterium]
MRLNQTFSLKNKILAQIAFCPLPFAFCLLLGCAKQDPILPGTRESVFDNNEVVVLNEALPSSFDQGPLALSPCPYRQDNNNVVWDGDKKIFSGFATDNFVAGVRTPACNGDFVYAGLSTGELVKVNAKTRYVAWVADIYRESNMTGGAGMTDIVASAQIADKAVYAGGLGDAFCKIKDSNGKKIWCLNIGVQYNFILTDNAAFVVATDGNLYGIDTASGAAYWRSAVKKQIAPILKDDVIVVGREKFDPRTGTKIK